MNKTNFYLFNIDQATFDTVRKSRLLEFRSRYKYKDRDQVLFVIVKKNEPVVVAEYEVVEMELLKVGKRLKLEPIYIAPKFSGLNINKLMKLQLSAEIRYAKKQERISKKDFNTLAKKLVS